MVSVRTPWLLSPQKVLALNVEIQSVGRSVSAVAFTEDGCGASRRGERDGEIAGIGVVRQDWNHHGLHGDVLCVVIWLLIDPPPASGMAISGVMLAE